MGLRSLGAVLRPFLSGPTSRGRGVRRVPTGVGMTFCHRIFACQRIGQSGANSTAPAQESSVIFTTSCVQPFRDWPALPVFGIDEDWLRRTPLADRIQISGPRDPDETAMLAKTRSARCVPAGLQRGSSQKTLPNSRDVGDLRDQSRCAPKSSGCQIPCVPRRSLRTVDRCRSGP